MTSTTGSDKAKSRCALYRCLRRYPKIAKIEVAYDGSGDQGALERFFYFDKEGEVLPLKDSKRKTNLDNCLEAYIFELLPMGWENNDGAFGTITIDVPAKKATVDHADRFTDYNHSMIEDSEEA